jgi:hypothetical protein
MEGGTGEGEWSRGPAPGGSSGGWRGPGRSAAGKEGLRAGARAADRENECLGCLQWGARGRPDLRAEGHGPPRGGPSGRGSR